MKGNKNSASEDMLGTLHKAVTTAFTRRVDDMLTKCEEAPDEIQFIIDEKFLTAASNFLHKNEIGASLPEQDAVSPLAKSLAEIKERQRGKVLSFTDEKKEAAL